MTKTFDNFKVLDTYIDILKVTINWCIRFMFQLEFIFDHVNLCFASKLPFPFKTYRTR